MLHPEGECWITTPAQKRQNPHTTIKKDGLVAMMQAAHPPAIQRIEQRMFQSIQFTPGEHA